MLRCHVCVFTQVKMEKKEKVIAARAASAPWFKGSSSGVVRCHWLAKKQKPTNHKKAQKPAIMTHLYSPVSNIDKTHNQYNYWMLDFPV